VGTVRQVRQEIEDAEAARAAALHPAFNRAPRVEEARRYEEQIAELHREHDELDVRGAR
jgi:hypothetical protein